MCQIRPWARVIFGCAGPQSQRLAVEPEIGDRAAGSRKWVCLGEDGGGDAGLDGSERSFADEFDHQIGGIGMDFGDARVTFGQDTAIRYLVVRVGADHGKARCVIDPAMDDAGRNDGCVAGLHFNHWACGSAELKHRRSARDADHFMSGGMITEPQRHSAP